MKILVTGANGYLGRGVVTSLLDKGVDVVATDITCDNIDERACVVECDLFSVANPFEEFGQPDVLLHLAWRDGFKHSSFAHIEDFSKHCTFVKNIATSRIKTIAVLGSMHEIGKHEGSINENTPCNPQNFYGIAKNALREVTEIVCKENKKNFIWIRGFYIVGNSVAGESIFSKISQACMRGDEKFPFTTGQNKFDFLDYDVFCDYVARAILQTEQCGIINVCSGKPEKLSDRVERFIEENNYNIKLDYGAFPDRDYDSKEVWGDDAKLLRILSSVSAEN